jgi:hypothetical protein
MATAPEHGGGGGRSSLRVSPAVGCLSAAIGRLQSRSR